MKRCRKCKSHGSLAAWYAEESGGVKKKETGFFFFFFFFLEQSTKVYHLVSR
jgi:hypothetical protein